MMMHAIVALLFCAVSFFRSSALLAAGDSSAGKPAETPLVIAYGVSLTSVIQASMSKYSSSTGEKAAALRDQGLSSDSVVLALTQGRAELGISGNPWEDTVEVFSRKKVLLKEVIALQHLKLGSDYILFVVSPGTPTKLTAEQLKAILTGKIRNWKEVGGDDMPIQIVLSDNTPATQLNLSKELLGGEDFYRKGVHIAPDFEAAVATVAGSTGAITFASSTIDLGKATVVKNITVKREVTAITVGVPSPRVEKFLKILEEALKASEKKAKELSSIAK